MLTTLTVLFTTLFDHDPLLRRARKLRAIQRVRWLHPVGVLLALVQSAVSDEHPSVATARRQFVLLTDYMPRRAASTSV